MYGTRSQPNITLSSYCRFNIKKTPVCKRHWNSKRYIAQIRAVSVTIVPPFNYTNTFCWGLDRIIWNLYWLSIYLKLALQSINIRIIFVHCQLSALVFSLCSLDFCSWFLQKKICIRHAFVGSGDRGLLQKPPEETVHKGYHSNWQDVAREEEWWRWRPGPTGGARSWSRLWICWR